MNKEMNMIYTVTGGYKVIDGSVNEEIVLETMESFTSKEDAIEYGENWIKDEYGFDYYDIAETVSE